jgi:hypothetical protein
VDGFKLRDDELIIGNFAGGGALVGIEWALGRSPDITDYSTDRPSAVRIVRLIRVTR